MLLKLGIKSSFSAMSRNSHNGPAWTVYSQIQTYVVFYGTATEINIAESFSNSQVLYVKQAFHVLFKLQLNLT